MHIMLLTIKNYLNISLRNDRWGCLSREIKNFWIKIKDNTILYQITSRKIMRREFSLKLISKLMMQIKNIGKHIIMILFLESFMMHKNRKNIKNKELLLKKNMEEMLMIFFHLPMFIDNLSLLTIPSLYQKMSKLSMREITMQRKDLKRNMLSLTNIQREMLKMKIDRMIS